MNEVEETLRVLNNQIEEYGIRHDDYQIAYDEFRSKCENIIDKDIYDFINNTLFQAMKHYENQINKSKEARQEIIDKYNINQEGTTNG